MVKKRKIGFVRIPTAREIYDILKYYLGGLYRRAGEHHIFLFGSGLAYSLLLCIIPFLLIIYSVFGILSQAESAKQHINVFINAAVPYREYADYARMFIFSRLTVIFEYRNLAGLIGVFGLLFAASGLFSSLRTVLGSIFGIKDDKSAFVEKLRDFGMVLFSVFFVLMATIVLPAVDLLESATRDWAWIRFFPFGVLRHFVVTGVSFLIIFAAFYICYRFIPDARPVRKVPAVSALWAAVFWELAKSAFGYYLYHFASLSKIYGAYTFVVVLALWIYYSSVLFLFGAEIGRLYGERLTLKAGRTEAQN